MFTPEKTEYKASGTDRYSFNLKNGWTLDDSHQFENGIWNDSRMLQRFSRRTLPELEAQLFDADQF